MKNQYEVRGEVTAVFLKLKSGEILETLIDTADLEKVCSFPGTWYSLYNPRYNSYYVIGKREGKKVWLHRFLLDTVEGMEVDHMDHSPLDNRRNNLRNTTKSQNQQNRRQANKGSKTGIRGIYWHERLKKWEVKIQVDKKQIYLGLFIEIGEAKKAVIKARSQFMPFSKEGPHEQ